MDKQEAIMYQLVLKGLGLYRVKVDGIWGKLSISAVKKFQRINPPLKETGILDEATIKELMHIESMPEREQHLGHEPKGEFPSQKDVPEFYGEMNTKQVIIQLPYPMKIAWDLNRPKLKSFTCHKKVQRAMLSIFRKTLTHYGIKEIERLGLDLFGGCLNVRKVRGSKGVWSMHSWGIAVDIDPAHNRFHWDHTKARLAGPEYEPFWDIVEECGATSLGREIDKDWMHFQFASL